MEFFLPLPLSLKHSSASTFCLVSHGRNPGASWCSSRISGPQCCVQQGQSNPPAPTLRHDHQIPAGTFPLKPSLWLLASAVLLPLLPVRAFSGRPTFTASKLQAAGCIQTAGNHPGSPTQGTVGMFRLPGGVKRPHRIL